MKWFVLLFFGFRNLYKKNKRKGEGIKSNNMWKTIMEKEVFLKNINLSGLQKIPEEYMTYMGKVLLIEVIIFS